MTELSNSTLAGILFQNYVFLWLQVRDSPLNQCQLLLTVVSKGLSVDSGSSTKLFAQLPCQVLWKFPNAEFKKANKPQRSWHVYIKKHFTVGTGSPRGCLAKMTSQREIINANHLLSLVGHSFSFLCSWCSTMGNWYMGYMVWLSFLRAIKTSKVIEVCSSSNQRIAVLRRFSLCSVETTRSPNDLPRLS